MQINKSPSQVIKKMEKYEKDFLLEASESRKKINPVKWTNITKLK